jgi:tetratricopeptide (TPR) repeat protein
MASWRWKGVLLLTSALVAGNAAASSNAAAAGGGKVLDLLDPAAVAASACGMTSQNAAAFKPIQVALATPAEAIGGDQGPPLWKGLGTLSHPITTSSEEAQRYFDQGLRLAYAFNHAEAYRAFKQAQALDPDCAMCFWGEAFVLGANINAPMEEGAVQPAFIALTNAKARAGKATAPEQALIDALAQRYVSTPEADGAALAEAYADAMARAHENYPDDQDIAVLFADAVMNTSPWNYWEADGRTPKGRLGEAVEAIEGVLAVNPDHPGAIHLYIHLTEASAAPERAEPYADRLAALMPAAGHIVHMPAHTYYRIGRYLDALETNVAAVAADEAYLAQVEATGAYLYGYYPHNIHFALMSAFMAGDAERALWAADRLEGKVQDEVAAEIGWIQLIKQGPYFTHAHLSEPDTVLAIEDPGDKFPLVEAMWHYARGVAFAGKGEVDQARREAAQIAEISRTHDPDTTYPADIASVANDMMAIARHVVEARIAQTEGDLDRAVAELETAVQIQDSLAYLEPPFWYYPVRQSLGAVLLMAGRPADAADVLRQSLVAAPNNGWALYGLMEAQKAQGDDVAAAATEQLFENAWAGKGRPELARL